MGHTVSAQGACDLARRACWLDHIAALAALVTPPAFLCCAAAGPRPDRLRADIARQAMPSSAAAGGAGRLGAGGSHAPARGLEVVAAHYSNGVLLLAEAAAGESRTRLFMLSRDLTIPPVGTATGTHVAVAGLREAVSQLELHTPGEACAIRHASLWGCAACRHL